MEQPLIGREPQYPTPWRLAEMRNDAERIAVAHGGHQAFSASPELARFLVDLVNWFAENGMTAEELRKWGESYRASLRAQGEAHYG